MPVGSVFGGAASALRGGCMPASPGAFAQPTYANCAHRPRRLCSRWGACPSGADRPQLRKGPDQPVNPTAATADPQRRNVTVLALAQALFMSVQGMGIATTPLAAYMLLGADEKWLATLPIFLVHLSIMGITIPASLLMAAIGRRAGFSLGALLGIAFGAAGRCRRSGASRPIAWRSPPPCSPTR